MTKYERAKQAIDDLFSDTSVPQSKTIEDLKTLLEEINVMIESIESNPLDE